MQEVCPISYERVDEKVVRINAALTVLSLIVFLFTPYKWIVFILGIDFFIRGFLNRKYSFYSALSKMTVSMLKEEASPVNAGPKIFAAKIGFIFCCMLSVLYLLNIQLWSFIVGSIFIFFAFLEAVFGFCLACKIYPFIYRDK